MSERTSRTSAPARPLSRALPFAVALALAAGTSAAFGAEPPAEPAPVMKSVTGETLDLGKLRERGPVLLDFWATWCKPCIAAMPELDALHRRFADRGLTVIGISVDGPRNFPKVRPFAQRLGLGFPIVLDEDGELARRYQARAIPTTVLIDRDGRLARVIQGWRPGETDDLGRAIEAMLADSLATPGP